VASDWPDALAVVVEAPRRIAVREIALAPPGEADVVVELDWSGVSAGTERLLWSGDMPPFPGLSYPLVPGYESVGRVIHAGESSGRRVGESVFVPGSSGFRDVHGLFGGAASRLVAPGMRTVPIDDALADRAVLLALSATAMHTLDVARDAAALEDPDERILIVGHGALGRLMARIALARGGAQPVVWERDPVRRAGRFDYPVLDPADDDRAAYPVVIDMSGDAAALDGLIARLAPQGLLVLAGFYHEPVRFDFAPAFLREARIRIAAEWQPEDLENARRAVLDGRLCLDGIITHTSSPRDADQAYAAAFGDRTCIKMVLDWRDTQ
jgi:3-hydroxyethyl bacteriochlorophyllide a dehydrogenase